MSSKSIRNLSNLADRWTQVKTKPLSFGRDNETGITRVGFQENEVPGIGGCHLS